MLSPYLRTGPFRELRHNGPAPGIGAAFREVPAVASLRQVSLVRSSGSLPLGRDDLAGLLHSPHLGRLEVLTLRGHAIGVDGAGLFAAADGLRSLTTLSVTMASLSDTFVPEFLRFPHLCRLQGLQLAQNFLTERGLAALADCAALSGLKYLDLRLNAFSAPGAELRRRLQERFAHVLL